ncbi:phosphoribosylformylglycinamidine cyclo-ligase [Peptoniphilus catoniae]|uniref:phosphoribosylformylglycinamidine cyclo-ligase n=1 Tax=Peptoniphilus catoniae TaxID=1660341 RepID=UPI0010FE1B32|nr:phosphoribosylformylglycinamidine cyclo-ligase [Peptoniphilus catoniae]
MINYKDSGVDIDSGNKAVELIKKHVKDTVTSGVLGDIGLFSGGFELSEFKNMKEPVLLASTDGVGTKLLIAQKMDIHDTVGIDLVAMCVNDLICQGAKPLFFLDYIGIDKIIPEKIAEIVKGVSKACKETGTAIIGGETAELPGMYQKDEYDLAGFSVGIVDKDKIIDGSKIKEGDLIIGLASSGLHSNGYSLARKLFLEELKMELTESFFGSEKTLGEVLLEPTKLYVNTILALIDRFNIKGVANITGGGLLENVPRIIPQGLAVSIDKNSWDIGEVFSAIKQSGKIEEEELYRAFNMGIGMIVIVDKDDASKVIEFIKESTDDEAYLIGEVKNSKNLNKSVEIK